MYVKKNINYGIRFFLLMMSMLLLANCSRIPRPSFLENRDKAYLSAQNVPPLRIPPGISSNAFHNYYPIPQRQYTMSEKNVSIVPPGLSS